MKALFLSSVFLMALGSQAFATEYKCVAAGLEATNSDIYYNLSAQDIDKLIAEGDYYTLKEVKRCSTETRTYKCIADSLQMSAGDIYYGLSQSEIDRILSDSQDPRFSTTAQAAKKCSRGIR